MHIRTARRSKKLCEDGSNERYRERPDGNNDAALFPDMLTSIDSDDTYDVPIDFEAMISLVLIVVLLCTGDASSSNSDYARICGRRLTTLMSNLCAASGCMPTLLQALDLRKESSSFLLVGFFSPAIQLAQRMLQESMKSNM
ncbi:hypothetical protein Tcan_08894 [Toxocara canis]|uniref:Uncharacterized protein n=1 Tax=Toxocara canis TaxID=6265 RepID=A0A0B2W388_TOXCA|nr:hypothetical protein Tcan_08894 [Toxocara canis]